MNNINNNHIPYYITVIFLIVAFNVSAIFNIKSETPISVTIAILVALLVVVLFKNFAITIGRNIYGAIAIVGIGIILTITIQQIALIYAAFGLLILMGIQFRVMRRSGALAFIGGNPIEKLNAKERTMAVSGLSMLLSVALTFFIQVLLLKDSI